MKKQDILVQFDKFLEHVARKKWDGSDAYTLTEFLMSIDDEALRKMTSPVIMARSDWAEGNISEDEFIDNVRQIREQVAQLTV